MPNFRNLRFFCLCLIWEGKLKVDYFGLNIAGNDLRLFAINIYVQPMTYITCIRNNIETE